ncbi:type III-B CRISPR module RAMP protein Cmr6 [Nocardiopsis alba]|uniref:type III-B CRISPR module RAMP protein Cmr6 n=1 Tax=Nocardiopsis alba TaxID=53437 RepID=UPI0035D53A80
MAGTPNPMQAFGGRGPRGPRPAPPAAGKPGPRPGGGGSGRGGKRPQGAGGSGARGTAYPANGPLGRVLRVEHKISETKTTTLLKHQIGEEWQDVSAQANALIVLRRLSFEPVDGGTNPWKNHVPLHEWATRTGLGQDDGDGLLRRTLERRRSFLRRWTKTGAERRHVRRLRLTVEWRMVSGHGLQFGVLDNGLALNGTYGWPTLPGSTLKGLAAAGARSAGAETAQVVRALGGPRPRFGKDPRPTQEEHRSGSVRFLDALPDVDTVKVHSDVITPHQHPYYTGTDPQGPDAARSDTNAPFPGEHHNPVPLPFLSISGDLRVDLLGDDKGDLDLVATWLGEASEELGAGGRTTAGYGYFEHTDVDEEDL